MAYDLKNRLVIGIASSALFDLTESYAVFNDHGEEEYRKYQEENLEACLMPGVAFPFIKRLLSLNDLSPSIQDPLVEVIVLSRNDPDTGLRVMNSFEKHGLSISRAIFMQGKSPYKFMPALNMSLFLSANEKDVAEGFIVHTSHTPTSLHSRRTASGSASFATSLFFKARNPGRAHIGAA